MPENQLLIPDKVSEYVADQITSSIDIDVDNEWKLGFLIAYNVQKFIIKLNHSEFPTSNQISGINPWEFESIIVSIFDKINNTIDPKLSINFDDIMDGFVSCWPKVSCNNPVISAFNSASIEFCDSDRSTSSKRSAINEMIVKRMCVILSIESEHFFIPTRELGSLLGQNRNYASNKINKLVKDGVLIKVNNGNRRSSPHYKLSKCDIIQ